jgi:hypothetical protein
MHMPLPIIPISGKINRVLTAGMLLWVAVWSSPTPAFGQGLDTWTCLAGSGNQNWSAKGNWDNGVPTAASDVVITSACPSTVDQSFTINNLGIIGGGKAIVGGGITLTINGTAINNNGQLVLYASSFTPGDAVLLIAGTVTLSGNGRLVMSSSPDSKPLDGKSVIRGGGSLDNQSTIEGGGQFHSELYLKNSGTINANANNATSIFVFGGSINAGTLESTGGGELVLSGNYENTAGMIGGNNVLLQSGATISRGTLSAGAIQGQSFVTLNGVTLAPGCQYQVTSAHRTALVGTISNSGQITLNETTPGSGAELLISGTVTLTGSGTITTNGPDNKIDGPGTIINQQTIQGLGTISVGGFNNQGMVIGNSTTAPMTIACPGTGLCSSTATIEGAQGGTVAVTCAGGGGCTLSDAGGTISNGTLNGGVTVSGGTLGGTVEGVNATLDGVTNIGDLLINSGDTTMFKGMFIDNGAVDMIGANCNPSCSQATAEIDGNVSLTGTGTWKLHGVNGFTPVIGGAAGQSDTMNNGILIDGTGIIGNGMNVINSGKGGINADSSLPLIIAGNSFADQAFSRWQRTPAQQPAS